MSANKLKKIIVTGGAGFIGSHLCRRLLHEGHTIFCLDNLYSGSLENILDLCPHPCFAFIDQDVCEPIHLEADEIYHLACPASPSYYQKDPIFTIRTCVLGACQVLELARRCNAKILLASTSEIYGDPAVHPQVETYTGAVNPIGPRACYDEGKRCAETLFFDYKRMYGLDIKVARIFNTYGPYMQKEDGRVISNFITQALDHQPLTIYGKGKQTRSFCYVDDLLEGLIRLMQSTHTGPFNLGNPEEYKVEELAQIILELTGSSSPFEYRPLPQDDPKVRCPDITLAKKHLNWTPKTQLLEGLQNTISFFEKLTSLRSH